jgi:hypothetical protein
VQTPPLDPSIAETAPTDPILTSYDEQHLIVYLRLLDAETDGADWQEVARVVLKLDPSVGAEGAKRTWSSHLERAHWLANSGYKHLLKGGAPN